MFNLNSLFRTQISFLIKLQNMSMYCEQLAKLVLQRINLNLME